MQVQDRGEGRRWRATITRKEHRGLEVEGGAHMEARGGAWVGVSGGGAPFVNACMPHDWHFPPRPGQWEAPCPWFRCTNGPSEMQAAANSSPVPRCAEAGQCDGVSNEIICASCRARDSVAMLPLPLESAESSSSRFHAHDEGASNWSRVNQYCEAFTCIAWAGRGGLVSATRPGLELLSLVPYPPPPEPEAECGPDRLVDSPGEFTALSSRPSRHIPGKVARKVPAALIFPCILGKEMVAVICRGEDNRRTVHPSSHPRGARSVASAFHTFP